MASSPGFITSISELALWVADVEKATAFYRDRLGFTVEEADSGHNAFLRSGDFLLVLFNRAAPNTVLARDYLGRTGGEARGEVYHVAFRVDAEELDRLGERLKVEGVAVKGPVEFNNGRRSYFFEDLDEHYIELTDR